MSTYGDLDIEEKEAIFSAIDSPDHECVVGCQYAPVSPTIKKAFFATAQKRQRHPHCTDKCAHVQLKAYLE